MKWLTKILVLVMVFSMTKISVLASEANISFTVDGRIANENIVTLNLITNEIKDLYAGSFNISFNKEQVEVIALEGADLLEESSVQEIKCIVDSNTNSIDYAFTQLANASGVEGAGNLLKIKLKLKDSKVDQEIFEEIQIKLVEDSSKQLNYFDLTIDKNLKESNNSSITKPENSGTETNGTSKPENSETNTNDTSKPGDSETNTNGTSKPENSETNTNDTSKPVNNETNTNDTSKPVNNETETNATIQSENNITDTDTEGNSSQIIDAEDVNSKNNTNSIETPTSQQDKNESHQSQVTDSLSSVNDTESMDNKSVEISSLGKITTLSIVVIILIVLFIKKKYL